MILGRNPGLWAGLVQAGLNLVAAGVVVVTGHDMTAADLALFAAANAFGTVVIGLIANAADPTTAPTFALTTTPPSADEVSAKLAPGAASGPGPSAPAALPPADPLTVPADPLPADVTAADSSSPS